jgi:predicted nucleotidyltransferase
MTLQGLLSLIENNKPLIEEIHKLIEIKASINESYRHPREPKIDRFLQEAIAQCESAGSLQQSSTSDYEPMNAFFRAMTE